MQNYDKDHYHENRSSELERRASKRENGEAHLQILYSGALMNDSTDESKIKLINHFYDPEKLTKVHRDRDRINNNWRIRLASWMQLKMLSLGGTNIQWELNTFISGSVDTMIHQGYLFQAY